jgi:hypothetical protein
MLLLMKITTVLGWVLVVMMYAAVAWTGELRRWPSRRR